MSIGNSERPQFKSRGNDRASCNHDASINERCYNTLGTVPGPKTHEGLQKCKDVNIKHGYYTREAIEERRTFRKTMKEYRDAINAP